MEIEPEYIPPPKHEYREQRRTTMVSARPGPLAMIVFGGLAIVIGAVLLFFMFWLALAFTAIGLIALGIQAIRRLLTGNKGNAGQSHSQSHSTVRIQIGRRPPD